MDFTSSEHYLRPPERSDPRRVEEGVRVHLMIAPADPISRRSRKPGRHLTVHAEAGPHLDARCRRFPRSASRRGASSVHPESAMSMCSTGLDLVLLMPVNPASAFRFHSAVLDRSAG